MNDAHNFKNGNGDESFGPPITDELDGLLREWHDANADAAKAGRDRLLAALRESSLHESPDHDAPAAMMAADVHINASPAPADAARQGFRNWRAFAARFTPAAAAIILIAILIAFNPSRQRRSHADVIYAPNGGALTALDAFGRTKGPCPLKDTFVDVDISGRFARVTLWQTFHNPYNDKIEAVYTFPMSHNGAVDRMTMSIGERIIIGEVHERERAKDIYETAKQQGHIAALLEQERPNIFTQSVANIEPGAEILVEISYIETLTPRNGLCEFAFPMVVAPRFIPATDDKPLGDAARFATRRKGVNLLAPGEIEIVERTEDFGDRALWSILDAAVPIEITNESAWQSDANGNPTRPIATFKTDYDTLADEPGAIYSNGSGQINGRWFAFDRGALSRGTSAVPDAPRITPPVAPPDTRAGHDIAISVSLDTGGPGITEIETPLHDTTITSDAYNNAGLVTHTNVELTNLSDIPNRDFVLRWRIESDDITDAVLTHTGDLGNFVTIMLDPPARVEADDLVPREIVFVVDTSGSMKGEPLNKAKQVMAQALEAMGPNDTFNVIAFSDDATPLWNAPREATLDNIDDAHVFVAGHESKGGTQMMQAVRMALASDNTSPSRNSNNLANHYNAIDIKQLATLSANGQHVVVWLDPHDIVALRPESDDDDITAAVILSDDASIYIRSLHQPVDTLRPEEAVLLTGWLRTGADGEPYIEADEFGPALRPAHLLRPADLRNFTPDDRHLRLLINCEDIDGFTNLETGEWIEGVSISDDEFVVVEGFQIHQHDDASAMLLSGRWTGGEETPRFIVESAIHVPREWTDPSPMRVVCFLTDGEVGNDMSIIDEIRNTADKTRFFSLGIGNSVNRYLLDGMAEAGRGAGDVILLEDNAHTAVQRFVQRMKAPVLLSPSIEFSDGLDIIDMQPDKLPDLFDEQPIVIHARYQTPGEGTITIRGDAADGPFARTISVELPEYEPRHESLPTLWARAKVDAIMNRDLKAAQRGSFPANWRNEIIDLGETFQIMTQYTSFVAVERLNVTYGGQPVRIEVPAELPDGMAPEGEIARQLMVNAENYETWPQRVDQEIAKQRELEEFAAIMDALVQHDQADAEKWDGDRSTNVETDSDAAASHGASVASPEFDENSAARKALQVRAPAIRFDAMPLDVVLNMLSKELQLEIAPDWSALGALAIDKNAQVSIGATDISYEKALELILDEAGGGEIDLGYTIQNGVIQILPKEELERRKAIRRAETQRLLASIQPFSEQDRTPTTPEEVDDLIAATKNRVLEEEIRSNVLKGDFDAALRLYDATILAIESDRSNLTQEEYDSTWNELLSIEEFINKERVAQTADESRQTTDASTQFDDDATGNVHATKQRRIRELVQRASALRKEGRLEDSIQVLDQVLAIEPDHEQAKWMRDTLADLSQSIRDRESVLARQIETRDVLIENDLSGIPYHQDMTYPKNWPEIAAKRQSPEELDSAVIDSNIDGSIGPNTTDSIDAGVPIMAMIPELKEQFAPKADHGNKSAKLESLANGSGTNRRSDMEIHTPTGKLSKKGTDIFRVEYQNGRFRRSLNEGRRGLMSRLDLDRALGQHGGNAHNRIGTARGHFMPAPDGSLILEGLEVSDERLQFDQFFPERIEIRGSQKDDTFGRQVGIAGNLSVGPSEVAGPKSPTQAYGALLGQPDLDVLVDHASGELILLGREEDVETLRRELAAIVDPTFGPDAEMYGANVQYNPTTRSLNSTAGSAISTYAHSRRSDAPASKQPVPDSSGSLDLWTAARSNNGTPRQFVSPPVSDEPTSFGVSVTFEPSPSATNYASGRPVTTTATLTLYADVASCNALDVLSTVGLNASTGNTGYSPLDLHGYTVDRIPAVDYAFAYEQTGSAHARAGASSKPHESATSGEHVAKQLGGQTRRVYALKNVNPEQVREMIEQLKSQSGSTLDSESQSEDPSIWDRLIRNGGVVAGAEFRGFSGAPDQPEPTVYDVELNPEQSLGKLSVEIDNAGQSINTSTSVTQSDDLDHDDAETSSMIADAIDDCPPRSAPNPAYQHPIPAFNFENEPLESAIQKLADAANIDITIDADALHAAGYNCDSRVTITTDAGNLTHALSQILNDLSADAEPLDVVATTQGLLITTQSAAKRMLGLVTTAHNIADFFAYEDLPPTLTSHDDTDMPPTWHMTRFIADIVTQDALTHAGRIRTSARFNGDNVIITHTPDFHRRIANWLAALRAARFEAPSSAADVYRVAAGLRAGTHNADDVLAMLNAYPNDSLARQLLDATLAQHANIVGPPPPLGSVTAMAANELRAAAARSKRISTCIDEPLLALMAGADITTSASSPAKQKRAGRATSRRNPASHQHAAPQPHRGRNGVTVSVLLADSSPSTIDSIRNNGMNVESVARSANVAIGDIPLARLADLATLKNVRRIEAARFNSQVFRQKHR